MAPQLPNRAALPPQLAGAAHPVAMQARAAAAAHGGRVAPQIPLGRALPPPMAGVHAGPPALAGAGAPAASFGTHGREHYNAFKAELLRINPKFNPNTSSLKELMKALKREADQPKQFIGQTEADKVLAARNLCANPNHKDIKKYLPAIQRLVKYWGTNFRYAPAPAAAAAVPLNRTRAADVVTAQEVSGLLSNVVMSDVAFSASTQQAADEHRIEGRTLAEIVRKDYTPEKEKEINDAYMAARVNASIARRGRMDLKDLQGIAKPVVQHKFATCETIAATVIAKCKEKGFGGRLEWIGNHYPSKKNEQIGHSFVVAHRAADSNLADVSTWGDYFIIDMWYFNFRMANKWLWDGADRQGYYQFEIAKPGRWLEQMAEVAGQ